MNMSVTDYIKYRLFETNPQLSEEEYVYEAATGSKHDYMTCGTVYFNHYLIKELIHQLCTEEEGTMQKNALQKATNKLRELGYRKYLNHTKE